MAIYFSTNYYSPPKPNAEDAMVALATVCSDIGCTVDEFSRSLEQLTRALNELQGRMCACENETYGYLRPELDALTEKSNQKTDLEISEQRGARRLLPIIEDRIIPIDTKDLDEWYENFLKELGYEQ